MTYVNTMHGPGKATFVDVSTAGVTKTASFSAKTTAVKVGSTVKQVIRDSIGYVVPTVVMDCSDTCALGSVNSSIKLDINFIRGDSATVLALETELLRLWAEWKTAYGLEGVVPPASATFVE